MKTTLICLLFLFSCASCHLSIGRQKEVQKNALDTTKLIIELYDFFIRSSNQKEIELFPLSVEVNIEGKKYYTYDEVINYYSNNYNTEVISSFEKKNNEFVEQIRHGIASEDLLHFQDKLYGTNNYKRKTFENDYLMYYFNGSLVNPRGNDVISNAAFETNLKQKIITNLYSVDSTIDSLIFSKHYKSLNNDSVAVPPFLKQIVLKALEKCKALLEPTEYEKVKNFNISFEKKNTTLWVRTSGNTIYISPFIIRAAYLFTINQSKSVFNFFYENKNNLLINRQRTIEDIRSLNETLLRRFMESFYFIFGHELAHEYLNRRAKDIETEKICDCYSYKHLKQFTAGIYETILEKSIKNGYENLWGVTNPGDLNERFNYLKGLHERVNAFTCYQ